MDRFQKKYPDSEKLNWNMDNYNFQVLKESDILISDYSGVIFDFSLVFDKPVIYTDTVYDKSPYDACWLDEEMWTFKTLCRIGNKLTEDSLPNIKDVIDRCIDDDSFAQAREAARNETWANRGCATADTVDYLINKQSELCREGKNTEVITGDR